MDDGLRAYGNSAHGWDSGRKRIQTGRLLLTHQPWLVPNPSAPREFIFGTSRDTINKTPWQRQTATHISPNRGQAIEVARVVIDKHPPIHCERLPFCSGQLRPNRTPHLQAPADDKETQTAPATQTSILPCVLCPFFSAPDKHETITQARCRDRDTDSTAVGRLHRFE